MTETLTKMHIRQRALQRRTAFQDLDRLKAEEKILISLDRALSKCSPCILGAYYPVRGEVDPGAFLSVLKKRGWTIALPVIDEETKTTPLVFRIYDEECYGRLEKGPYNIPQPSVTAPHVKPDIMLVPLLAFSAERHRAGYGAGYYDRTIDLYRKSDYSLQTYGLAFECQRFDELPFEAHDHPLDVIITEEKVYSKK